MKNKNNLVLLINIILETKVQGDLKTFFTKNPDFDLNTTKLERAFEKTNKDNLKNKDALFLELKNINKTLS